MLESWLDGEYDQFDHVLFSRAEDSSQRLYYYICELQRLGQIGGPEPLLFDIAKIPRESSIQHTALKVRELADLVGIDDAAIEAAIVSANKAGSFETANTADNAVVLSGTAAPDDRLHRAIESAGFSSCGETLIEEWTHDTGAAESGTGDPATAIARALHADPRGPRSFSDPAAMLRNKLERFRPKAVILWRIEEDEALTWHQPAERRLLEERAIPHLVMARRDWLARDGAADEIREFLGGLDA